MTTSGQSTQSPRKNLADLGIELPEVAAPVASYAPAVISGDMIYVSGQLPFRNGELPGDGQSWRWRVRGGRGRLRPPGGT